MRLPWTVSSEDPEIITAASAKVWLKHKASRSSCQLLQSMQVCLVKLILKTSFGKWAQGFGTTSGLIKGIWLWSSRKVGTLISVCWIELIIIEATLSCCTMLNEDQKLHPALCVWYSFFWSLLPSYLPVVCQLICYKQNTISTYRIGRTLRTGKALRTGKVTYTFI